MTNKEPSHLSQAPSPQADISSEAWSDPAIHVSGTEVVIGGNEFPFHLLGSSGLHDVVQLDFSGRQKIGLANRIQEVAIMDADPETKAGAVEILADGTLHGREALFPEAIRSSSNGVQDRQALADLFLRSPEIAEEFVRKDVAGFHGTRSSALGGMLESGLLSTRLLREQGKGLVTGEHFNQVAEGQDSISFSTLGGISAPLASAGPNLGHARTNQEVKEDLRRRIASVRQDKPDVPASTAVIAETQKVLDDFEADPLSLQAELLRRDFPLLVSVSKKAVRQQETTRRKGHLRSGTGDLFEFRPAAESISLEDVPCIVVPDSEMAYVKGLFSKYGHGSISVLPIEQFATKP